METRDKIDLTVPRGETWLSPGNIRTDAGYITRQQANCINVKHTEGPGADIHM